MGDTLNNDKENPKKELDYFQLESKKREDNANRFKDDEASKSFYETMKPSFTTSVFNTTKTFTPGEVKAITGGIDYSEVEKELGKGYNIFNGTTAKDMGIAQSGFDQFKGFLNQAVLGEVVGGTIEGTGYLLNMMGTYDMFKGEMDDFGNAISDLGFGIKEWSQEATPIYGSEEMWSSGWFAKGMVSVASTLSLMIPAMGTVKAAGALGRGLGFIKGAEALTQGQKVARAFRVGMSQAVVSRHMENWMEAREVYDNTLNEYINNRGMSLEDAKKSASEAVRTSYIANSVMVMQDFAQYMLMGTKAFGTVEASNELLKLAGKTAPGILGSKIATGALNMASEGFEEAYQYVVGKEALQYQLYQDKLEKDPIGNLSRHLKDNEFWTSVIFGALGAGVHQTIGSGINNLLYKKETQEIDKKRIENLTAVKDVNARLTKKLVEAQASGNQESIDDAVNEITLNNSLNAYQAGNSELALETLKMIQQSSNEELLALGLEENKIEEFKENIGKAIDKANDVFKRLKSNSKIFSDDVLRTVTYTQIQIENHQKKAKDISKNVSDLENKDENLSSLSPEARTIVKNKTFNSHAEKQVKILEAIVEGMPKTQATEKQFESTKEFLESLKAKIENNNKENQEIVENLKKNKEAESKFVTVGDFLNEKAEKEINDALQTSNINANLAEAYNKEFANKKILEDLKESLNYYGSKEFQEKMASERKKRNEEAIEKEAEKQENERKQAEEVAKNEAIVNENKEKVENTSIATESQLEEEKQTVKEKLVSQDSELVEAKSLVETIDDMVENGINVNNGDGVITFTKEKELVKELIFLAHTNKLDENSEHGVFKLYVDAHINGTSLEDTEGDVKENAEYFTSQIFNNAIAIKTLLSDVKNEIGNVAKTPFQDLKEEVVKKEKEIEKQAEAEVLESQEQIKKAKEQNAKNNKDNTLKSDVAVAENYEAENLGVLKEDFEVPSAIEHNALAYRSSSALDNDLNEINDYVLVQLTKFLENPDIDITEYEAEFEIDTDYFKIKHSKAKKAKESYEAYLSNDKSKVGQIPVKVFFKHTKTGKRVLMPNGNQLFSHLKSDTFWNDKQVADKADIISNLLTLRVAIIDELVNGKRASSKFTHKKRGTLQQQVVKKDGKTIGIMKPLKEALNFSEKQIIETEFFTGDSSGQFIDSKNNVVGGTGRNATPGATYIKFRTNNGQVFPARIMPIGIEEAEANFLFEVYKEYVSNKGFNLNLGFNEVIKSNKEIEAAYKNSLLLQNLIVLLGDNVSVKDVLSEIVYQGATTIGTGINELNVNKGKLYINGSIFEVKDFNNKKEEIKALFKNKFFNVNKNKLSETEYKKFLFENNLLKTQIRIKPGYTTPFSTPVTVFEDVLNEDSDRSKKSESNKAKIKSLEGRISSLEGLQKIQPNDSNLKVLNSLKQELNELKNTEENTAQNNQFTDIETEIKRKNKETENKIKNKELFLAEFDENGNKISGSVGEIISQSNVAPIATSVIEQNGFEFVEFSNPQTGQVDVIVTGDTKGNYIGFYRLYENNKPTNKWSSKMNSKDKNAFKIMMSGIQDMLPQGHEYTEKTSISTDGLRVWNQQLEKGYELQYDNNGNLITNTVAINGDALINELGIDVNQGNFDNIRVTNNEDFNKVKKALLPYLQKFGLDESNIKYLDENSEVKIDGKIVKNTVVINLPVLRKKALEQTTSINTQSEIEAKKAEIENFKNQTLPREEVNLTGNKYVDHFIQSTSNIEDAGLDGYLLHEHGKEEGQKYIDAINNNKQLIKKEQLKWNNNNNKNNIEKALKTGNISSIILPDNTSNVNLSNKSKVTFKTIEGEFSLSNKTPNSKGEYNFIDKNTGEMYLLPLDYVSKIEYDGYTVYNAELKALESTTETVEEVKTDTVVEETPIVNEKAKKVKSKLEELENKKLKKDDFEAFSTKENPQLSNKEKLNEALDLLDKMLPKSISIKLQNDVIRIFENGHVGVASFKNAMITLSSYATNKDAFHEAFHAVFRALLTGQERQDIINSAKNEFLAPSDEEVKLLMERFSLSKESATNLYYEEKLADEFGDYMDNPSKYKFTNTNKANFYERVISWLKNIFSVKSKREKLFSAIKNGAYSKSEININNEIGLQSIKTLSKKEIDNKNPFNEYLATTQEKNKVSINEEQFNSLSLEEQNELLDQAKNC
jgi:hypothetical protein